MSDFSDFLTDLIELPSLSPSTRNAFDIMDNHDASIREIAELLEKDPGVVARILQVANSASYGFSAKVKSVTDAMVKIGTGKAKTTILMSTLFDGIGNEKLIEYLRKHSIAVSLTSKFFARKGGYSKAEDCGSIGLIHDIGQISFILYDVKVQKKKDVLIPDEYSTKDEIEKYGMSHSAAGASLLNAWHLPPVFVDTVSHHHSLEGIPQEITKPVSAVGLGELCVNGYLATRPESDAETALFMMYLKTLNIKKDDFMEESARILDGIDQL